MDMLSGRHRLVSEALWCDIADIAACWASCMISKHAQRYKGFLAQAANMLAKRVASRQRCLASTCALILVPDITVSGGNSDQLAEPIALIF